MKIRTSKDLVPSLTARRLRRVVYFAVILCIKELADLPLPCIDFSFISKYKKQENTKNTFVLENLKAGELYFPPPVPEFSVKTLSLTS